LEEILIIQYPCTGSAFCAIKIWPEIEIIKTYVKSLPDHLLTSLLIEESVWNIILNWVGWSDSLSILYGPIQYISYTCRYVQFSKSEFNPNLHYDLHTHIWHLFSLKGNLNISFLLLFVVYALSWGPPLWSSDQSSWLQIQRSGFDSRRYQIFWEVVGLERGPLNLLSTIEELLEWKSSGSSLENRDYGRMDSSRWLSWTLYPQKLALTSLTSGGRSVGIVRSRTQTTEFSLVLVMHCLENC
jgi:hypothetical protein